MKHVIFYAYATITGVRFRAINRLWESIIVENFSVRFSGVDSVSVDSQVPCMFNGSSACVTLDYMASNMFLLMTF
jgi:hypothetical protein